MNRDRLKLPIIIVSVLLVVAIAFGVFMALDNCSGSAYESGTKAKEMSSVYFDGVAYTRKNIVTYLLIGIDEFGEAQESGSYNNTQQADFLALLVVNKTDKTYSVVHINRDTMANIDRLGIGGMKAGLVYEQIALSHTYGDGLEMSCQNTARAVSRLLGRGKTYNGNAKDFEIDYYISMTMDAVAKVNDYLGGVTITLSDEEDLSEINEKWIPGATITLTGNDALLFVRSRMSVQDGTNISRMNRQRHYIEELIKQQQGKVYSYSYASDLYAEIKEYTVTNCTLSNFDDILSYVSAYEYTETLTPAGEARVGEKFMEFYVDEKKLDEMVRDNFYEKRD